MKLYLSIFAAVVSVGVFVCLPETWQAKISRFAMQIFALQNGKIVIVIIAIIVALAIVLPKLIRSGAKLRRQFNDR